MKYTDADRLRAEIKRRIDATINIHHIPCHRREELEGLLSFIDSLQQEPQEVDLEKEIEKYYYDNFAFISSAHTPTKDIVSDIATHFYERGQRKAAEMYDEIEYNRQRATGVISFEYRIVGRNTIENLDMSELEKAGIGWGDNVIVQIRKKEESK